MCPTCRRRSPMTRASRRGRCGRTCRRCSPPRRFPWTRRSVPSRAVAALAPALGSEAMRLARLPKEAVSLEAPFPVLGFDSVKITTLHGRLRLALGVDVELAALMAHSIASLTEAIIGGHASPTAPLGGGGGTSAASSSPVRRAALDEAAAPAVDALVPFELLPMQSLYWAGRSAMASPPQPAWIQWEATLHELDAPRFEAAVDALVARHGALRTVVLPSGLQRIEAAAPAPFRLLQHACGAASASEAHSRLQAVREDMIASFGASYPLWKVQAVQEPSGGWRLLFVFDLLIADAQALCVLTEELHALYERGADARLPSISLTLPVYVDRVARRRAAAHEQRRREENFWSKADAPPEEGGMPPCPQLPMLQGGRHSVEMGASISRISGGLPAPQWQALRRTAAFKGLTPTSVLFAAYVHVLAGWSASPHFTLNCAFFSRDESLDAEVGRLVGNLAGTILVDVDASAQSTPSFEALAKALQARVLATMEHSKCTSGADVMGRLNRRDDTPGRAVAPFVFASALGATEPRGDEAADAARRDNPFTWYGRTPASTALTTPQVWLDVQVFNDVDGGLYFNWDSHAELFPPGLIHTMFDAFSSLLERLACDAPRTLSERPSLVPESQTLTRRAQRARDEAAPPDAGRARAAPRGARRATHAGAHRRRRRRQRRGARLQDAAGARTRLRAACRRRRGGGRRRRRRRAAAAAAGGARHGQGLGAGGGRPRGAARGLRVRAALGAPARQPHGVHPAGRRGARRAA